MVVDCRDEQHDVVRNAVRRTCMNDVGGIQFPSTCYVAPQGSNSGYTHPPCLCGDKGSNLGLPTDAMIATSTYSILVTSRVNSGPRTGS